MIETTPQCCEHRGLYFAPDLNEKRCPRHATEEQRARVRAVDARALAHKTVHRVPVKYRQDIPRWFQLEWPYGPNIDVVAREALCDWAEPRGLRLYKRGDHGRFLRIPQPDRWGTWPESVPESFRLGGYMPAHILRWGDHVTAWTRDKKPAVLISQPYGCPPGVLDGLVRDGAAVGLRVLITPGWYGHGATGIEVWHPDQLAEVSPEAEREAVQS